MTKTALILGASGKFGRHTSAALKNAGWTIRHFDRTRDDITEMADGADLIVNGLNPAGYVNWETDIPRITDMVIGAARASGATVLVPGNVYPFGTQAGPWSDSTPHAPNTSKGRIRAEMEARYRDAAASGLRVILLRAGDFIDTRATGNWLDMVIVKPLAKGRISYPGRPDIPHAWSYLPDLGRAAAALAEMRHDLPAFADISFPGYTLTGQEIADSLSRSTGRSISVKRMPWLPLKLAGLVWKTGRALVEMRYLWETPHALAPCRFNALLPAFRETEIDAALAEASGLNIHPDQTMIRTHGLA